MFEKETTEILLKFLDKKTREAEKEIEEKGTLSDDNAIPLLLKTQFNHIAHLDMELSNLRELIDKRFEQVDKRFEQVDQRFEQVDQRFEQIDKKFGHIENKFSRLENWLIIGFSFISLLIIIIGFLKQ